MGNERSMRLDRFASSVSEAVPETPNDEEVSLPPPPPPAPPSPPVAAPLPNLLPMPTTSAHSLSSLPETAYGLTRPKGFPQYETVSRQTQSLTPSSYPVKFQAAVTFPYSPVTIIR